MKKLFLILLILLSLSSLPLVANATLCAPTHPELANSIVPCGQFADCPCEFSDFFTMIRKVYIFITWTIALPLAGLLIVIGGAMIVLSGGNPNLFDKGKTILWGAAWGVGLILGAWVIVNLIFMALRSNISWFSF